MKNLIKFIFSIAILFAFVFGAIYLFSNINVNAQVSLAFNNQKNMRLNNDAKTSRDEIETMSVSTEMQETKIRIAMANDCIDALNLKLNKLINLSSGATEVVKIYSDNVINAYNRLNESLNEFIEKKNKFIINYASSSITEIEKKAQYNYLYTLLVKQVNLEINLLKNFDDYASRYIYKNVEVITLQNALINSMQIIVEAAYENVLTQTSYTTNLTNEIKATLNYYLSLNGDYSESANFTNKNNKFVTAYENMENLNEFLISNSKTTLINSYTGLNKTYATSIYDVLGGV